ncbi:DinB family protein [Streptomyces flavofungini]|uniref:DinB family protein n=1 Tax=Streptomyces flavofungini TaxID=68200 RepID=UPI0034DE636B
MTTSRRTAFFTGQESDPRYGGPATGDERTLLTGFLRSQRATLEIKCAGLSSELARRSVEPSALSLLGLVRHLTDMERRWFRRDLAGQDVAPRYATPENADADFDDASAEPEAVAAAWEAWRAEVAFAERFVTGAADLDVEGEDPWLGPVSLRWVLIHMIEEYARHNGHADLLRERIDGAVGW